MEKRTPKKEKTYQIHPSWKWVIFAAVVIYCGITILSQQSTINEHKQTLLDLETQKQELSKRIDALEEEISYMGTDEYVERTARDRLGMVKEDEIIFKDTDEENKAA